MPRGEEQRLTLPALLREKADRNGSRRFAFYNEKAISYADAYQDASRFAGALHGLGVRKGQKVAILMANCLEYLSAWFGTVMLGAVEVPVNYNLRGHSLEFVLGQSDS